MYIDYVLTCITVLRDRNKNVVLRSDFLRNTICITAFYNVNKKKGFHLKTKLTEIYSYLKPEI